VQEENYAITTISSRPKNISERKEVAPPLRPRARKKKKRTDPSPAKAGTHQKTFRLANEKTDCYKGSNKANRGEEGVRAKRENFSDAIARDDKLSPGEN